MRATTFPSRRLLLLLSAVALLLAGCFGDDVGGESGWRPPESADAWDVPVRQVVEAMERNGFDCTGLRLAELPPRNSRPAGVCRLKGELVEVVTFGDQEERFGFLTSRRSDDGYTPQATIVAGPRWAIGIQDRELAERIGRTLGGALHQGTIGIPT